MQLDDLAADVQPEPHAGHARERPTSVGLIKPVENIRAVLGWHADTVILHRKLDRLGILPQGHVDAAPSGLYFMALSSRLVATCSMRSGSNDSHSSSGSRASSE